MGKFRKEERRVEKKRGKKEKNSHKKRRLEKKRLEKIVEKTGYISRKREWMAIPSIHILQSFKTHPMNGGPWARNIIHWFQK